MKFVFLFLQLLIAHQTVSYQQVPDTSIQNISTFCENTPMLHQVKNICENEYIHGKPFICWIVGNCYIVFVEEPEYYQVIAGQFADSGTKDTRYYITNKESEVLNGLFSKEIKQTIRHTSNYQPLFDMFARFGRDGELLLSFYPGLDIILDERGHPKTILTYAEQQLLGKILFRYLEDCHKKSH